MKNATRQLLTLFFLLIVLSGCVSAPSSSESLIDLETDYPSASGATEVKRPLGKTEEVTLERVVDGDTLNVAFANGATESVRLLLVDTPETSHPTLPVQPFGVEAKTFLTRWLEKGQTLTLEYDVGRYDRYQRTLAYVWVDGLLVNEELLRRGLARVAYVYAPNTQHVDAFRAVERTAMTERLGIWSIEDYVTDRGFDASKTTPRQPAEREDDCAIKGNINREGDKIYHMPGGASYERTNPEAMFCSEAEAEAAGFRKALR